jgi:N-methylhydantoinase A
MAKLRFSIDIGGTFTDIVVLDEDTGIFVTDKAHTTPQNTLLGMMNAINKVGLNVADVQRLFVHGSVMFQRSHDTTVLRCTILNTINHPR